MARYEQHMHRRPHGFKISDATLDGDEPWRRKDLIWVGIGGEGRWLKPEEALELAAAVEQVAQRHIDRMFQLHHQRFLRNHP